MWIEERLLGRAVLALEPGDQCWGQATLQRVLLRFIAISQRAWGGQLPRSPKHLSPAALLTDSGYFSGPNRTASPPAPAYSPQKAFYSGTMCSTFKPSFLDRTPTLATLSKSDSTINSDCPRTAKRRPPPCSWTRAISPGPTRQPHRPRPPTRPKRPSTAAPGARPSSRRS